MPCNSDYMNASGYEIELSRVACLLDELDGQPFNQSDWNGYHPAVYNKSSKADGDLMVRELCTRLMGLDVSKLSLEMQMWWRDHQAADRVREAREKKDAEQKRIKAEALAKLSPEEKAALGIRG